VTSIEQRQVGFIAGIVIIAAMMIAACIVLLG
jgi:hypothetical protein